MEGNRVSFGYDGLYLVRLVLQKYTEKHFNEHPIKAIRFAHYEYLRLLEDNVLEEFLLRYLKAEGMDAITLVEWEKDCKAVWDYVYETDTYKNLVVDYQRKGYGITGLGVVDTSDNTFYDCGFTGHWTKVQDIIKEKYPHYYEPLMELTYGHSKEEFNGVSRQELDNFVLSTFEFTGGNKQLDTYLE